MHSSTDKNKKSKEKVIVIIISMAVISFLLCITFYKSPADVYINEIKENIPTIKTLFSSRGELLDEAHRILNKERSEVVFIDTPYGQDGFIDIRVRLTTSNEAAESKAYSLCDTPVLSAEEKLVLSEVIILLQQNIGFVNMGYGGYTVNEYGRNSFGVYKLNAEELKRYSQGFYYYTENVVDDWYAVITTPPLV